MSDPALRLEVKDQIGLLTIDQPGSRANVLSSAMLVEWEGMVAELEKKPLAGLVLKSGKPGMFIAGADLKELGSGKQSPEMVRVMVQRGLGVIARIEKLSYPTVAAIEGPCLGGGLELAMGFDYRIASTHPKTEVGQPEVKIGLIPGWGGTQRLTRLIGPALSAELVCGGDNINAVKARDYGIVFDAVPSDRLLPEALRLLAWSSQTKDWQLQRKKKQLPVGLSEEQLTFTHEVTKGQVFAKTKGQLPAPLAGLEAVVKGCNLPLEDGLKIETDLFVPLVGSPVSMNLIAVFFMSQRLQKDPGVSDASIKPKEVKRVGVIGAGLMGAGIAGAHIRRGIPVMMLDIDAKLIDKGLSAIRGVLESRIKIGRMKVEEAAEVLGRLSSTTSLAALGDRDVVIEAVVENEQVKTKVYQDLQAILPDGAILASNTSTISITRMAKAWKKPESFAGMHFFNPVDRMQLVEVIRGEKTSDETAATLVALAKQIGKTPIVVKDCPGFLVNRILFPYINESLVLLEEGASPREIDKAALAFGMPMGPITLNDVVGNDTALYAGRVVNTAFADRAVTTTILDELVKAGRLGQKTGAGFYGYAKGPKGIDDPAFDAILQKIRKGQRKIPMEEITERLFLPMLTEASRILMEGIVREPADVDMGLILGIGFPAFKGGLLRWADGIGLPKVLLLLKKYASFGRRFEPTEQMQKLATAGKGFYSQ